LYAGWHGSKYFYGHCVADGHPRINFKHRQLIPFLWVFDMETKKWSEIRLEFSFNKYSYQANIDSDGVLNFILHGSDGFVEEPTKFDVTLIRMPLR
jgi:hypothetical protein